MRIQRIDANDHWDFHVWLDSNAPHELQAFGQLIRELRRDGLPFLVGGTALDPKLGLTIGPLEIERALAFQRDWAAWMT